MEKNVSQKKTKNVTMQALKLFKTVPVGAWLETPVGRALEMWPLWTTTILRSTLNVLEDAQM